MSKKFAWYCDSCAKVTETFNRLPDGWLELFMKNGEKTWGFVFCGFNCLGKWINNQENLKVGDIRAKPDVKMSDVFNKAEKGGD